MKTGPARSLLAIFGAWLAASPADAVLVPIDVHAEDDAKATLDTDTGLEWLDVELTRNLSFGDVASGAGGWIANGWRPATTAEVCGLVTGHAVAIASCPSPFFVREDPAADVVSFLDLLGVTEFYEVEVAPGVIVRGRGLLGVFDDGGDPEWVGWAYVMDAGLARLIYGFLSSDLALVTEYGGAPTSRASDIGVFLVRPVPEPTSASLLALGLAALAFRRRSASR